MTTISLDNKICAFEMLSSRRFPRKTAFLNNFPLYPHAEKCKFHFLFVLSQSLRQISPNFSCIDRERKMRTNFFLHELSEHPQGFGASRQNSRDIQQILLFETQGRQTFGGEHGLFGHHPFAWKTPTPLGGLRTQKANLCALFCCLNIRECQMPL